MTRIILVRHGQTPWNKDKIFRGSRDIPLNDQGREEARLAGEWLKGETIHAAYCSPLSRARDTGRGHRPAPRPEGGGLAGAHRPLLRRLGGPAPHRGQGEIRRPLPPVGERPPHGALPPGRDPG